MLILYTNTRNYTETKLHCLISKLKSCAQIVSAQKCQNAGEIFKECGSACERTCRDLARDVQCSEECIPGCQCPDGQLLNDEKRCVPIVQCPCQYEGREIKAGDAVKVGKCETWYELFTQFLTSSDYVVFLNGIPSCCY